MLTGDRGADRVTALCGTRDSASGRVSQPDAAGPDFRQERKRSRRPGRAGCSC